MATAAGATSPEEQPVERFGSRRDGPRRAAGREGKAPGGRTCQHVEDTLDDDRPMGTGPDPLLRPNRAAHDSPTRPGRTKLTGSDGGGGEEAREAAVLFLGRSRYRQRMARVAKTWAKRGMRG